MTARDIVMGAAGAASPDKTYIEDVFSTYLYTGNGSTQTINNGIDLAGKGGMVWIKGRSGATDNALYDTARGATYDLVSNTDAAQTTQSTGLTSFVSTGFSIGSLAKLNTSAATYASWTFRKAPKFFDVVTYTGNGGIQTINHALGQIPGMIIVRSISTGGQGWIVNHEGLPEEWVSVLNSNGVGLNTTLFSQKRPTASSFEVNATNAASTNSNGVTYVAYIFGSDTSPDGLIKCGNYVGNGSTSGPVITLGWEPQYLMIKSISGTTGNWQVIDNMRDMLVSYPDATLQANLSNAEASADYVRPTSTGFQITSTNSEVNSSGASYIYMAIRRGPMRTPTDATKVFKPDVYVGTSNPLTRTIGFPHDLIIGGTRSGATGFRIPGFFSRLQGHGKWMYSAATDTETNFNKLYSPDFSSPTGTVTVTNSGEVNSSGINHYMHYFQRAPGFFDVVCYTGTGVARTVDHNLGVAPELMIVKSRSSTDNWQVYCKALSEDGNSYLLLNDTAAAQTNGSTRFTGAPTSTQINLSTNGSVNGSSSTYVAYLFASCPGVSKVGSYTGNDTSQTIDCGFTNGARFILIKRTNSTGDWYFWDTARGISASNDPHLSLNNKNSEVTTNDTVDPASTGFVVNQNGFTNVNVSGGSYIYLAIA